MGFFTDTTSGNSSRVGIIEYLLHAFDMARRRHAARVASSERATPIPTPSTPRAPRLTTPPRPVAAPPVPFVPDAADRTTQMSGDPGRTTDFRLTCPPKHGPAGK